MRQVFLFVFIGFSTLIFAQKGNFISMGPDISLPSTNLKGTSMKDPSRFEATKAL